MSATHGFKFIAADGKKRLSDALDSEGVIKLAKNFPNTKLMKFLDWFLYNDNTIDGQSKKNNAVRTTWRAWGRSRIARKGRSFEEQGEKERL